jgi:hypothetical protein
MNLKIGVIGNCQARGFARSVSTLLPGCAIVLVHAQRVISGTEAQREHWADNLKTCDIVFTQPAEEPSFGTLTASALEASCRQTVRFPYIAFSGFHPDCHYIRVDGRMLQGPLGPYHSAIVAASFLEGLTERQTASLFNSYTYASLGYFDLFTKSTHALIRDTSALGFDVSAFSSLQHGCFMHTINHPAIEILYEIARQALTGARLTPATTASRPGDELAGAIVWPVYPDLGKRLSIHGSWDFQASATMTSDLENFIQRSFAAYRETDTTFSTPLIDRMRVFISKNFINRRAA